MTSSIAAIEAGAENTGSSEKPIFVFSAGWRSGSTLLQRLLMSGNDTLIWGEAYDRACIIQRLTETVFAHSETWPDREYLRQPTSLHRLSSKWVANLYPPRAALKLGYRALLENMFVVPAREVGARRWGFKEVRLGVNEAEFLHWLFPNARFLFIYRNPFDAYQSYKNFQPAKNWYVRWPDKTAFTTAKFAKHWRELASDFVKNASNVDGMLVKYEDLIDGRVNLDVLADYCELDIDKSILEVRLGGMNKAGCGVSSLTGIERLIISRCTAPTACQLGYLAG
ncbi:MAG: sulfotransferase [Oleiphilaceae bacterium]|nr:sulfotransferase [Oleiphilaceae bacterium]